MKKIKLLLLALIVLIIQNNPHLKAEEIYTIKNDSIIIDKLVVNNKELSYNKKLDVYPVRFTENQDKLKIYVQFTDKNITYKIEGNQNIKDGSIVRIFAKNEKQETTEFDILVTVKETPSPLKVLIGGTSLIVAIGSLFMIMIIKITGRN